MFVCWSALCKHKSIGEMSAIEWNTVLSNADNDYYIIMWWHDIVHNAIFYCSTITDKKENVVNHRGYWIYI